MFYVSTYEGVRHMLDTNGVKDLRIKALVGGSCASLGKWMFCTLVVQQNCTKHTVKSVQMVAVSVGQTVIVPFDVISQHMMVLGLAARQVGGAAPSREPVAANPLAVATEGRSKWQVTWDIARTIYTRDGLRGFYRGYVASLCTYVPSSACWWTFYSSYQVLGSTRLELDSTTAQKSKLINPLCQMFGAALAPAWAPHTMLQCVAAVMSGQNNPNIQLRRTK